MKGGVGVGLGLAENRRPTKDRSSQRPIIITNRSWLASNIMFRESATYQTKNINEKMGGKGL